jgi:HK97 family phage prohead protease
MNQRLLQRGAGKLMPVAVGTGVFEGYASLFGKRDQQGDVVMAGAFAQSLHSKGPENIRMLFQHNPAEPVGTWVELVERPRGLWVRGRLNLKVQRGRELLALLESGGLDGLSIGFKTIRARNDRASGTRSLLHIDLWEISLVTFPMLDGARVSTVKSAARARADTYFKLPPAPPMQGVI